MIYIKRKGILPVELSVMAEYLPLFTKAFWLTVRLGLVGIVLAIFLGVLCAVIQFFKIPVLKQITSVYIEISRNTPLLIQLFFIYYGLPKIGIRTTPEACGIAGMVFLGGGYMAEAFRSSLDGVERIQYESAATLGMTDSQVMRLVILPQAASTCIPPLTANIIFLLKETSVFSAVSLMDLMFTAKDLIGLYHNTVECMVLLVLFYLIMLLPVSILGTFAERKLRYAGFGD